MLAASRRCCGQDHAGLARWTYSVDIGVQVLLAKAQKAGVAHVNGGFGPCDTGALLAL
jgi:hypothetical protein